MRTTNGGSTMTLELEAGEELQRHVLQAAVTRAVTDPNMWAVYLIILPAVANANKDLLLECGFLYSGNLSRGNETFLRCKRHIRTSGEAGGSNLAVAQPTLSPTDMERHAIERMRQEMSKPVDEARLRALQEGRSYDDQGNRL